MIKGVPLMVSSDISPLIPNPRELALMKLTLPFAALATAFGCLMTFATGAVLADSPAADADGFVSLFDGKTLDGWKPSEENPDSFSVVDGKIKVAGPRAHLFYVGDQAPFTNFHFVADVMTTPGANSGLYLRTQYQASGWPKYGYECQVNASHSDPKRSSSLYDVVNVGEPPIKDNEWYRQEIIVEGRRIRLLINGEVMVDYTEPEDKPAFSNDFERRLGQPGTFAIQAHDPQSVAYFRNLKVKPLD